MEIVRGQRQSALCREGCVLTIGNFDGVHRGHQALLQQVKALARQHRLPSVVMVFEPHPQEFFSAAPPARLLTLREKIDVINAHGIDAVICLRFNAALAATSAEAFIDDILLRRLNVKHLVIGDDFRFGRQRSGDVAMLRRDGRFAVYASDSVCVEATRVSSTVIRQALADGDMARAERLLGHPYTIGGRVAHGDKRGRLLGFPTANIVLKRRSLPLTGVYAVRVNGIDDRVVTGVANVGVRPTVNGTQARLEVHLFDFSGDIYGRRLAVQLLHKLRGEQKFDGLPALQAQIARDVEQAKAFLQR
jgi:riboflavin kinase/FMN adenylyltransferase